MCFKCCLMNVMYGSAVKHFHPTIQNMLNNGRYFNVAESVELNLYSVCTLSGQKYADTPAHL